MSRLRQLLRPLKRRWEERAFRQAGDDLHLTGRWQLPSLLNARGLSGTGVEVGVFEGFFTCFLLENWRGNKLIAVDPWRHFDSGYKDDCNQGQADMDQLFAATQAKLAPFGPRIEISRHLSNEAAARCADASLDFVYIDAQHHYAAVKEDLHLWWPKLKPGSMFAGHDYMDGSFPFGEFGVKSAVDEFVRGHKLKLYVTAEAASPSWFFFKP